jgi:hypothetical protein
MTRKPEPMTEATLLDMMTYQRRARSKGEARFIERFLQGYPQDSFGNFRIEVDPRNTTTLFSCHTDSVHPTTGISQRIMLDTARNEVFKNDKYALGADDAVGMWLMLNMIHREVPGVYVFHRDEEIGGYGSAWISKNDVAFLSRFERAIAFDRAGTRDVITHQLGERCASDTFAWALAGALGGKHRAADNGVFTDTANYMDVIPECTNLSVGYENQHSGNETQDLSHASMLLDLTPCIEWEGLPTARDPDAMEQGAPSDEVTYGSVAYWKAYDGGTGEGVNVLFPSQDDAHDWMERNPIEAARMLYEAYRAENY